MASGVAQVKLFERADFEQAIIQAAEHFATRGLRPAVIEKDYYVTEALRAIAATGQTNNHNNRIIFKGGTSLSKGWNLIQRFSTRQERHRPETEGAAGRRRGSSRAHFCRGRKPDYRRIWSQRPLCLHSTLWQSGRSSQPRSPRSRYSHEGPETTGSSNCYLTPPTRTT